METLNYPFVAFAQVAARLASGAEVAESTDRLSINFTQPWPWWLAALLSVLGLSAISWIYRRDTQDRSRPACILLFLLRSSLLLIVVWMTLGPTWYPFRTELPELVVLLDDSASMSIVDKQSVTAVVRARLRASGLEEPSRINQAKSLLLDDRFLSSLSDRYRVLVYSLSSEAALRRNEDGQVSDQQIRSIRAEQESSPLGSWILGKLHLRRGKPTAAVVLISDGVVTAGATLNSVARRSRSTEIPFFTVAVGQSQAARDIRIDELSYQDQALVNDIVSFDFQINSIGFDDRDLKVRLREADGPILTSQQVVLSQANPPRVTLIHQPNNVRKWNYLIEVDIVDEETDPSNNSASCPVNVRDDSIDVLLGQAYPSYEYRYLQQTLARQVEDDSASIKLTTVLQTADPEFAKVNPTMRSTIPHTLEELLQFDVIVLGDINPDFITRELEENLISFVDEHGRAIVFIAGTDYMPAAFEGHVLEKLFPFPINAVESQTFDARPFGVALTPLGAQKPHLRLAASQVENAELWRSLNPLFWRLDVRSLDPGVQLLVETNNGSRGSSPLICEQYIGAGRVRFHFTDETCRWRMRVGDEFFARYWLQTLRYLSNRQLHDGQRVRLTSDRQLYRLGSRVQLNAQFIEPNQSAHATPVEVTVQSDEVVQRIQLTRAPTGSTFAGAISNLPEGRYRATLTSLAEKVTASCQFEIQPGSQEMAQLEADVASLSRLADQTNGRHYTMKSASRLPDELPRGERRRVEQMNAVPIWNAWQVAFLFVTLITTEWMLRKRMGLH